MIHCADLFCGAGGTSSGLLDAAAELNVAVDLLAVNHWEVAIATHSANHPGVRHICKSIEGINPREAVPGGRLQLLVASPECVHFSNARGGKPMSDQSRACAWHILHWLETLDVRNVLIENVREFRDWGPLYPDDHPDQAKRNRPIPEKKGSFYRNFLRNLRVLGYTVADRLLNAADYGDATTRVRLFIQARKGRRRLTWPEPSHLAPDLDSLGLFADAPRWRPARDIIDWDLPAESIFGRKRPLAPNTLARILAGLRKFCGLPFIVPQFSEQQPRSVEAPLGTITTTSRGIGLVEPFLVVLRNNCDARALCDPVPAICGNGQHLGLAEPFIVPLNHGANDLRSHSLAAPMPTVTSVDAWGRCAPYLVKYYEGSAACSVDQPLPAITANYEHLGLAQPYLVEYHGERRGQEPRCRSVDEPLLAIGTANFPGLVQPFLVKFNGTGGPQSLDHPLDTISTRDRFALVHPELYDKGQGVVVGLLDIRFRMLQPHELAAAHSFARDYRFPGNREQKVRQIGNSVPRRLAAALCRAILARELTRGKEAP